MTALKDRIPVEPVDDDRWARIERGVVASVRETYRARRGVRDGDARARGRRLVWGGVALAAVAAAVIGVVVVRSPGAGGGAAEPLQVVTDDRGTRVNLGEATVEAGAATAFTVTRPGGGLELSLVRGRIELDVPHRAGKAPLIVHAGDVDVIDVGTVFAVTRGEVVTVEVREGEVQIARGGETARVVAGQRWVEPMTAGAGAGTNGAGTGGASGGAVSASGAGAGLTASAGAGNEPPRGAAGGPDAIGDRPPPIPVGGPGDLLERPHVANAPHEGSGGSGASTSPTGARAPGGASAATGGHHASTGAGGTGGGSAAIDDLGAAILREPIAPAVDVDTKDPAAAFQAYQALFAGTGTAASQGLYGMARTRFTTGQLGEAMHLLDAYRKRFPDGAETEAVLWLRVRILCRSAITAECRAAAQTYLTGFPGGDRSHLVERITVTVSR